MVEGTAISLDERVADLKARFSKMGIAGYRISGLDEHESLVSFLREKDSFRYAFIREPYTRSKNLIFRLMKIDIWRPSLPMGYCGSPGFTFDYLGADPLKEAISLANIILRRKYKARKIGVDRVSFCKIFDSDINLSESDKARLVKRNYNKITWNK